MLDLSIFGATKRIISRLNRKEFRYIQTDHLRKILDSLAEACTPSKIVGSFRLGGISLFLDADRVMRCLITPKTARRVMHIFGEPTAIYFDVMQEEEEEEEEAYSPMPDEPENIRHAVAEIRRMLEPHGYLSTAGLEEED
jgi:hypothetical protein